MSFNQILINYVVNQLTADLKGNDDIPETVVIDPDAFLAFADCETGAGGYQILTDNLRDITSQRISMKRVHDDAESRLDGYVFDQVFFDFDEETHQRSKLIIKLSEVFRATFRARQFDNGKSLDVAYPPS